MNESTRNQCGVVALHHLLPGDTMSQGIREEARAASSGIQLRLDRVPTSQKRLKPNNADDHRPIRRRQLAEPAVDVAL